MQDVVTLTQRKWLAPSLRFIFLTAPYSRNHTIHIFVLNSLMHMMFILTSVGELINRSMKTLAIRHRLSAFVTHAPHASISFMMNLSLNFLVWSQLMATTP